MAEFERSGVPLAIEDLDRLPEWGTIDISDYVGSLWDPWHPEYRGSGPNRGAYPVHSPVRTSAY